MPFEKQDITKVLNHYLNLILSKEQLGEIQTSLLLILEEGIPLEKILQNSTTFTLKPDATLSKQQQTIDKPEKKKSLPVKINQQKPKEQKKTIISTKKLDKTPLLKNTNNKPELAEQIDEAEIKLDDSPRQLPKKLMAALTTMSDDISNLNTDEYGEWLLDITKDDDLTRRILQNGHLLTLLLRHLYRKKEMKDVGTEIYLFDAPTQTEIIYNARS